MIIDDVPKIIQNRVVSLTCPKENTILMTTEPSSIARYGRGFAKQFQYLITNQDKDILPHPNASYSQTGNVWMYGKDYDELVKVTQIQKSKKLSTICSNKQMGHTMHKLRFDFTKKLQEEIPDMVRCGWGYNPIEKSRGFR